VSRDFSVYDSRHYKTLSVADGYAEWSKTYHAMELDLDMIDRPLLDSSTSIPWNEITCAVDLACGTGRVGAYLKSVRRIAHIDGADTCSAMLDRAHSRKIYRDLLAADVCATTLKSSSCDLAICALAACHLENISRLYQEGARIVRSGGVFVLIDFHQFFLLQGIPTHFDRASGESVAIRNYVHFASDHIRAGLASGFQLAEMQERIVDEEYVAKAPRMKNYLHRPIGFMLVWRRL
jgi:ubiquinone/menaquinone biosynthesis C-methylase UbiE